MSELKIIATIVIKKEYKEELEKVFHTVVDETRKEPGNVSYALHQDTKNAQKYVILEVWKNQEAIDLHNNTPHFKSFAAAINGKIEGLEIDIVKEIY